jgi:hypothetical protein
MSVQRVGKSAITERYIAFKCAMLQLDIQYAQHERTSDNQEEPRVQKDSYQMFPALSQNDREPLGPT